MLEHRALDADRLVLAQPLDDLVDGAEERAVASRPVISRQRAEALVGVGSSRPTTQPSIIEKRSGSRPAAAGGVVEDAAALARLVDSREDGVVLVGERDRGPHRARLRASADDDRRPRLLHRLRPDVAAVRPLARRSPRAGGRARRAARASSRNGKPYASCSASYQPAPIPSSTRPPETWSTVTTFFASTAAGRNVTGETIVPRRSRSVRRRARRGSPTRRANRPARRARSSGSGRSGRAPRARRASAARASASHCSQVTPSCPSIIRQIASSLRSHVRGRQAAVDEEGRAGHVRGLVARQEERAVDDLAGPGEAPGRPVGSPPLEGGRVVAGDRRAAMGSRPGPGRAR